MHRFYDFIIQVSHETTAIDFVQTFNALKLYIDSTFVEKYCYRFSVRLSVFRKFHQIGSPKLSKNI